MGDCGNCDLRDVLLTWGLRFSLCGVLELIYGAKQPAAYQEEAEVT